MRLSLLFAWLLLTPLVLGARVTPVEHVIVLMMENRSFDHMLGWLKASKPELDGLTGSESNLVDPTNPSSTRVHVTKDGYDVGPDDPLHDLDSVTEQLFGHSPAPAPGEIATMSGFVRSAARNNHNVSNPMSMFTPALDSAPILNTLASEFAVFDRWYCSVPGPTDPNRGYIMSGTSLGRTDNFDGNLWPQQSYFDFLRERGRTWRAYYQDDPWAVFYFNDTVNNPLNNRCLQPFDAFFQDLTRDAGLAQFTFLQPRTTPNNNGPPTWQHPDASVKEGERLVKTVYEALRASRFWNSSALVITYDEHGGFYDHVPPPQAGVPNPDGLRGPTGFNFDRLGVRVPTVVVSPWVRRGVVVHEPTGPTPTSQYDHTSVIATTNKLLGIPVSDHASARVRWAGTFEFLFTQLKAPRTDCPLTLPSLPRWTLKDLQTQRAKPLNEHQINQVLYYCKFNHKNAKGCGQNIKTQGDVEKFLQREVPHFMASLK